VGTLDRGVEALLKVAGEGDAVLTLGAGSVWQAGEKLLARLKTGAGG
jgi:UDP-N-acetylmuramate--alanine ligase